MMGWVRCPTCGTQYIDDPQQLTLWFSPDNDFPICEYICPNCGWKTEDHVSLEAAKLISMQGVIIKSFNDRYTLLNEIDIDSWDIDSELSQIGL